MRAVSARPYKVRVISLNSNSCKTVQQEGCAASGWAQALLPISLLPQQAQQFLPYSAVRRMTVSTGSHPSGRAIRQPLPSFCRSRGVSP